MIEDKILKTINTYNLIEPEDIIVVAVSGGPDSMCLLNALFDLKDKLKIKKMVVAHVNHMLRKEAEEETEYVKNFCKSKNIEFYLKYVDIKKISEDNKTGEEETGRYERYKFFEEVANKVNANKIAIAHNSNDNAETLLMHLLRGSGISGLAGIRPERDGKYIRPIIKCTRNEIEEYCNEKKLNPKYDKSNNNNEYTRNRIRNELIPYLKKNFNPNIIETLNRLSDSVLIEENFINNVVIQTYNKILIEELKEKIVIKSDEFNKIDEALKPRIILYIVKKLFGSTDGIEKVNLEDIIKLSSNNIGNKYLKPNKKIKVFIKSCELSFEKSIEII